jgi:recombination protein RecT
MTQQLTTIDHFKQQIAGEAVQQNLHEFMPDPKALKKFTAVTIRAVQENPDLLNADRKSLFLACQRAAQDGLMPDNREGALVIYGKHVQWQPMISGIRKKMAQAGWDIRAEIVYENDHFEYELGDKPTMVHRPQVFGKRGQMVGAYAIATNLETGEKYRETMSMDDVKKVKSMVRGKSPAWTMWEEQMIRKSVAKRLRNWLPISDDSLLDLIDRDNEQFDLNQRPQPSSVAREVQAAVRAEEPIEGEVVEPEPEKPKPKKKKAAKKEPEPEVEVEVTVEEEPEQNPLDDF